NAVLNGLGFARLLSYHIQEELDNGQLVSLFADQMPPGLTTQAVFTHRRNLSPRVQVFLEFLSTHCTVS
ncbi:MAG: LysR substrate-binding domain-containing protein, partial [Cyanobacteria bacterium P01_F01_bin.116]